MPIDNKRYADEAKMIIMQKPKDSLNAFLQAYNAIHSIDINEMKGVIKDSISYHRGEKESNAIQLKRLEDAWYSALKEGRADYSIYNDKYYFIDLWVCWILYSRGYLRSLIRKGSLDGHASIYEMLKDTVTVLDLGCGLGHTTASLKQIFREATVYGTNIKDTKQYVFCRIMGKKYKFNILPDVKHIKHTIDLVFASEYFEHIHTAIDHLKEIISRLHPKYFYMSNSFSISGLGHFEEYKYKDGLIMSYCKQKEMARKFNKILMYNGYKRVKTKLWNRPVLWRREH